MLLVTEPAMVVSPIVQQAVRHPIHITGRDQTVILQQHNLQVVCLLVPIILQ